MTLRLVGSMSLVLLLSLAAFGLVMNHYHDQVMEEVAHTASAVGKATLRTLESPGEGPGSVPFGSMATWVGERVVVVRATTEGTLTGDEHFSRDRTWVEEHELSPIAPGTTVVKEIIDCPSTVAEAGGGPCGAIHGEIRRFEGGQRIDVQLRPASERFFISSEDLRVDVDAVEDALVLRIPRFTPAGELAENGNRFAYRFESEGDASAALMLAKHDELRLPIPVEDYDQLYETLRQRTLFLFLGVFLVGMVLSTGLATRFTRPIRRLDAGIRRLSAGELDVAVEVRGEDEIGRLGRAFNDMTHKLREGRDRQREVVRREKLSALGGLAAGVAHDVRNPLHSIGLTLQHMSETCRPADDERASEFDRSLDVIRGEIRRLDQMVANFLRFARSDRRERQPVDLADVLQETERLIRKEAEWRGIEVELDVNAAVPPISADGESLRSSILNLVLNSFEAMPQGGSLALRLSVEGPNVVIEIEDDGRGIPEEDQERVFEFAYTTREGGSGLGLAMVQQCVVEDHGGRVSLDSRPGEGTHVRLGLPIRPVERGESR